MLSRREDEAAYHGPQETEAAGVGMKIGRISAWACLTRIEDEEEVSLRRNT